MDIVMNFIKSDIFHLVFALISLIFLILFIIVNIRLKKLNKNYETFMRKLGKGDNLDEMLKRYVNQVQIVNDKTEDLNKYCNRLDAEITNCIQRVGIIRYSAFKDTGSDLSFALALLNDNNDGVVLNGIYSREMSNIYAKQVIKGEAVSKASEEERKAIEIATMQGEGPKIK